MTVPVDGNLEIRHEVSRVKVAEAGLNTGERYKTSMIDICLGTRWWTFGGLDTLEGVRFRLERRRGD